MSASVIIVLSKYYFNVSAWAIPSLALDIWDPDQKGTAISAKSFWDCHTLAKNLFLAAFFSN